MSYAKISADAQTLLRQASLTAAEYMLQARKEIDAVFGDGYAIEHPELVIAFMKCASIDFSVALVVQTLQHLDVRT